MPAVDRPTLAWQVDWTDTGTYGQTAGYPPANLAPYIESAYIESGGGSYRRSTAEDARVQGRVAGRIRLSNADGVWSANGVTTYDTALTRPHRGRLTHSGSTRQTIQEYRIEIVHADSESCEIQVSSLYPMLDTRLPDELTTAGNVTPAAYARAVLTHAAAVDSNLSKPAVRSTVPAAIRVGASGSTLDVPDRRVSDVLDDLGVGCLGWWSEDYDGVPHLWTLTSVGSATRYATVNRTWRPHQNSSRISRPIGMLRNVMPSDPTETTRTQVLSYSLTVQQISDLFNNVGSARNNRTLTYTLPAPPSGGTYVLDSVAYSATLQRISVYVQPGVATDERIREASTYEGVTVTSLFSLASSTLAGNTITIVVANDFEDYVPVTWEVLWQRRYSDGTLRSQSRRDVTLQAGFISGREPSGLVASPLINGLTVTATATYRQTVSNEISNSASVQRYGRRPLPAQTEDLPMFGQLATGRATLPILAGPPVLADLTVPLWSTSLTPAPETLRIGDRVQISLQGQAFDAAILSLRWQVDSGRAPSVRILALQCRSGITDVTPAPRPPPGITVTPGNGSLAVAWSAPSGGTTPDGYEVQWKLETAGTYQSHTLTGTSYTITGLTNGSAYDVRVRSTHTAGNSTWVVSEGTPVAPIPAPSAVQSLAAQRGDAQVTLTWSAPATGTPTRYRVRYRPTGSQAAHTTGTHDASPVTITGLTNGTEYTFEVRGEDQTNTLFGPWTSVRQTPTSAAPDPAPGVPTGLTVTPSGSFTLLVEWVAPTTGGTVVSYTLRWRRQGNSTWTERTGFGGASGSISSLNPGTAYEVAVRANGTDQNSDYTATVTASTLVPAPDTPVSLSGVPGDSQVALTWAAAATGGVPTDADLQYRQGNSGDWTDVTIGLVFAYTVTGLTNGTSYQFRVRHSNAGGTSGWTSPLAVTPALPQPPPVPSGVAVVPGDARLVVSWQAAARADSYDVRLNTAGTWATAATGVTALTYSLTGLTNGTTYGVAVRAVNTGGTSAWSATINRTPQQSQPAPTLSVLGATGNNVQIRIAYSTPAGWRIVPRNDGQYQIQKDDGDGTWDSFFLNAITAGQQPLWGQLQGAYWVNNVSWADSVSGQRRFRLRMHIRPRGAGQEANAIYTEWATADVPRPASQSEDSPQLIPLTLDGYLVTLDSHYTATLEVL